MTAHINVLKDAIKGDWLGNFPPDDPGDGRPRIDPETNIPMVGPERLVPTTDEVDAAMADTVPLSSLNQAGGVAGVGMDGKIAPQVVPLPGMVHVAGRLNDQGTMDTLATAIRRAGSLNDQGTFD